MEGSIGATAPSSPVKGASGTYDTHVPKPSARPPRVPRRKQNPVRVCVSATETEQKTQKG